MAEILSLQKYCKSCGSTCCGGSLGYPRIDAAENMNLSLMLGVDKVIDESGYWVPSRADNRCCFLDRNEGCKAHKYGIKPMDCQLYPVVPMLNADDSITWFIDKSCPAAPYLTADYYADTILLGMGWIRKANAQLLAAYAKKYRPREMEHTLTAIAEYLKGSPRDFIRSIKQSLEKRPGMQLKKWLEKNNSFESLGFIVNVIPPSEKSEEVRAALKLIITSGKYEPRKGKTDYAWCFKECAEQLIEQEIGKLSLEEFVEIFSQEVLGGQEAKTA